MFFNLKNWADNTCLIDQKYGQFTYSDVYGIISNICSNLEPRGLMLCLCRNSIGSVTGYIAAINNETVPLLIDANTDQGLIERYIDNYSPDYIWCPKDIYINDFKNIYESHDYKLLKISKSVAKNIHPSLALLLPTSGSTGSIKLVRLSYANIISNTKSIVDYLEIKSEHCTITTLPMHYTFGLSIINTYLYSGASIVLSTSTIMEKQFWSIFESNPITSISGVPYTFEMLEKIKFFKKKHGNLQVITQAGGKLGESLQYLISDYANKYNIKFYVMYGQTEATARMSYLPPGQSKSKIGSIGIAIPGGKFKIFDDNGNEILDSDTQGELIYYGDNVSMGYSENIEDLSKGNLLENILHTGDIATKDQDGYFYIKGRKSRFVKIYGARFSLFEIESSLFEKYNHYGFCCIGSDDNLKIITETSIELIEIKKYVAKKFKINTQAISCNYTETLPRTSSGKISYKEIEELFKTKY